MRLIKAGAADQSVMIRFLDGTTGLPVTTVVTATAGLTVTYRRTGATAVALTSGSTPAINDLAALTTAHTDAGLKHIADGWYRFDLPDDAVLSGVTCVVSATATGLVGFGTVLQLVPFDPQNATTLGLTNLDGKVSDAVAAPAAALVAVNLDHLVKVAKDTDWATTVTKESIIDLMTSKGASQTFDRATDSNEAIRDKLPANLEDLAVTDTTGLVSVADNQKVDVNTIGTKGVTVDSGGTTFPAVVGSSTYAGADTSGTTELLTRIPDADPGTVGGLPTVDASNYVAGIQGTINTFDGLNDFDPSTDSVTLAATQGAITWDQQKITANAASEGAVHITNVGADGVGIYADAPAYGIEASGGVIGQYNTADGINSSGQYNESLGMGGFGLRLVATNAVDPAWAEPGADSDTLETLSDQIDTAQGTLTKLEAMIEADGPDYRYTANALEEAPTAGSVDLSDITDVTDKLDTMLEADGTNYKYTADSLQEAPTGGASLTQQQVRDAMLLAATPPGIAVADSIDDKLDDIPTNPYTGTPPTAVQNAEALLDHTLSDHTTSGSVGDALANAVDPWAAASRTLTQTAASVAAAVSGSTLSITSGAGYSATLTGMTIPATWTAIVFSAKSDLSDPDSSSVIQIRETNGGAAGDGLLYLEKAAIALADRDHGALTVNQGAGTVRIDLLAAATTLLGVHGGVAYDLKLFRSDGEPSILTASVLDVHLTPTRAIV